MSVTILRAYAHYPQQLLAVVKSGTTSPVRGRSSMEIRHPREKSSTQS